MSSAVDPIQSMVMSIEGQVSESIPSNGRFMMNSFNFSSVMPSEATVDLPPLNRDSPPGPTGFEVSRAQHHGKVVLSASHDL